MKVLDGRPHSDVPGVAWRPARSKWLAVKSVDGVRHVLGSFTEQVDAEAAVDAWTQTAPAKTDDLPRLGRTRMTDEQIAYALSIAHELRGF